MPGVDSKAFPWRVIERIVRTGAERSAGRQDRLSSDNPPQRDTGKLWSLVYSSILKIFSRYTLDGARKRGYLLWREVVSRSLQQSIGVAVARTKPVQSVLRGIDLLDLLSEAPGGMRLGEMACALDLKAPTVHNLARTLAMRGLVNQTEGGLYALGSGLLEMADRARRSRQQREAERVVQDLGALECRPIINYSIPSTTRVVVRLRVSPDRPGIVQHPSHRDNPIYSTANGLAFMAFAPEDQVIALRQSQPFHEYGIRLWKSPEELDDFLALCRERGYAVPPFPGQELFRASAPVRDADGVATAYLGAAVPVARMGEASERERLIARVCEAAEDLCSRAHQHSAANP